MARQRELSTYPNEERHGMTASVVDGFDDLPMECKN